MIKVYSGIDLTNFKRKEFRNNKLVDRILHKKELEHYYSLKGINKRKFLASRWALKEAFYKATNKKIPMCKILIEYNNQPYIQFEGKIYNCSLSYEGKYIVANVIAVD